jgi:hypothetical protein
MPASTVTGHVTVYESSDGGTGDPAKTLWQFFVDNHPVTTENHFLAQTIRVAIGTNSQVQVTFDDMTKKLSQVRIEFKYCCETRRLAECKQQPGIAG